MQHCIALLLQAARIESLDLFANPGSKFRKWLQVYMEKQFHPEVNSFSLGK